MLADWDPLVLAVVAAGLAIVGLLVMIFSLRRRSPDMMGMMRGAPKAIQPRWETAPVDLSKPIRGEEAWAAILAAAPDEAYRNAVGMMRKRFGEGLPPMKLATMLRTTMDREAVNFREAVIRLAEIPDADIR
ncbi:hypothetical protein [Falsiroseomonas sp. HW251]|uniref:hypothetical protein n=1 Tax=Falsiroseomonas sp. HW251 TaxID=3390998 RepID=UPI003D314F05